MDARYKKHERRPFREAIKAVDLEAHARTVFSQRDIISRTAMVLISGVKECGLAHAMPFLQQQCESHNIPYAHIASLSAMTENHKHEIRMEQIGPQGKLIIESCTNTFLYGPERKAA